MKPSIQISRAPVEDLIPLRWERLIAGTGRPSAEFDGDREATARHYAAREGGAVVGCATCFASSWEGEPAWQLRGMAVAEDRAGSGVGRELLEFIDRDLVEAGDVRLMWCNAREHAIGFYEKLGWRVESEPFEIPGVCPHVKMTKRILASG